MPTIQEQLAAIEFAITDKIAVNSITPEDVGLAMAELVAEPILFADLVTKMTGATLQQNKEYLITDFKTVHFIVDSQGNQYLDAIIEGDLEPLIVRAISTSKLSHAATSTIYPQDLIHVDFDESNWLADPAFADLGGPTIVTGWKGTIYFRHDKLNDVSTGYDFRNVKFRRWKIDPSMAWDSGTNYFLSSHVTKGGWLYAATNKAANTNKDPETETDYWAKVLDITTNEYWLPGISSIPLMTADEDEFSDFKTFEPAAGVDITYEDGVRSVHIAPFRDSFDFYDFAGTLLSNNVFFMPSEGFYNYLSFEIGPESNFMTFCCGYAAHNTLGWTCQLSLFSGDFHDNFFGTFGSCIGHNLTNNRMNTFMSQIGFGSGFNANRASHEIGLTVFGNNCVRNNFCGLSQSSFGEGCASNDLVGTIENSTFGNNMQNCKLVGSLNAVTIANGATSCEFFGASAGFFTSVGLFYCRFQGPLPALDFTVANAPRLYQFIFKEVGLGVGSQPYVKYVDNTPAQVLVAYDTP